MQVSQPVLHVLAGVINGTAICRLHKIALINKGKYATSHTRF